MALAEFKTPKTNTVSAVEPAVWMRTALDSLEQFDKGTESGIHAILRKQFVFSNCVIQAFEAILKANKITTEEARLANELVQNYLCDDLLTALGEEYISVIHRLLMPFSEAEDTNRTKPKTCVSNHLSVLNAPADFV